LTPGIAGGFGGGCGSSAVVRADDQDLDALGDQGFHVGFFFGRGALAEQISTS
jgi:hypothetical protein